MIDTRLAVKGWNLSHARYVQVDGLTFVELHNEVICWVFSLLKSNSDASCREIRLENSFNYLQTKERNTFFSTAKKPDVIPPKLRVNKPPF